MNPMRPLLLLIAAVTLTTAAQGAELTIRAQAESSSSIVRLGDVVDISGASEQEFKELAAIPLVPAPAPGTQQYLAAAQIRDLLAAAGVDVSSLQFHGAAAVAIASPAVSAPPTDPTPAPHETFDEASVADQLTSAIVAHLQAQTGHDLWDVDLVSNSKLVEAFHQFGSELEVRGGRAPWTGKQKFEVDAPRLKQPISAYATVARRQMVVFAVRPIALGDFVRATDVELRSYAGNASTRAVASLDAVIGKEAMQAIRPESIVLSNQLRSPLLVRRGERVSVRARAGGILVRTYATAQQDGSLGDLIRVQALEGRERYAARVAGLRELEVFAAGTTASDVAAFGQ
jgi:flagella basal body P-ring formation protein FlgA